MLINSKGEQKESACFERDYTTEADGACSINWNNQLFIFGGFTYGRVISRLTGHKLEDVGSLDFDHRYGSCSVMKDKFIYLCFNEVVYNSGDADDLKRCRRSSGPLKQFSHVVLSTYDHRLTKTSCSDCKS